MSDSDLDIIKDLNSARTENKGLKRMKYEDLYKRNTRKIMKDHGKAYKTNTGKDVHAKVFKKIRKCCKNNCCVNIDEESQIIFFNDFWKLGNKDKQDTFIATCLIPSKPKTRVSNAIIKEKPYNWRYSVQFGGTPTSVCKSFFTNFLQVSCKRVRVVQSKVVSNINNDNISLMISDNRGKHQNRPNKISENVWTLVKTHWEAIPHSISHYCANKTKREYFDNSELTPKTLFELFKTYFFVKTGSVLKMKYSSYFKFYRKSCPYSIRQPKTDVCDFCMKSKILLNGDHNSSDKKAYDLHVSKYKRHDAIKKELLQKCKTDSSVLVLEFDYGQNRPLPKLNNNSQYYKRMLWLYIFNVHCHNDGDSTLYWFLECDGNKNSNSVVSLLYDFISKKFDYGITKKIYLFSDAAGGQNKNITMVKFCAWLSKNLSIPIEHIFPVRGHSFNQCDRNFGMYGPILKRKDNIETVHTYLEIFKKSRINPSPFNIIDGTLLLKNWSKLLQEVSYQKLTSKGKPFKIQMYVRFLYKDGNVMTSPTYTPVWAPFRVIRGNGITQEVECHEEKEAQLKPRKINDLKYLQRYLSIDGQNWFNENVLN